jgi:hypothetical protein
VVAGELESSARIGPVEQLAHSLGLTTKQLLYGAVVGTILLLGFISSLEKNRQPRPLPVDAPPPTPEQQRQLLKTQQVSLLLITLLTAGFSIAKLLQLKGQHISEWRMGLVLLVSVSNLFFLASQKYVQVVGQETRTEPTIAEAQARGLGLAVNIPAVLLAAGLWVCQLLGIVPASTAFWIAAIAATVGVIISSMARLLAAHAGDNPLW